MADDDKNDDYTQIFGVGSELGGTSLWICFCSVAAYLLVFSGLLDKLETLTIGTSYHLMLQRIYREIMMVGFGSFAFTILNQTDAEFPFGLSQAFGFADICCFAMSTFFCLQGVFIMVSSVKQAQNWNIASQMPAEELLHNMSVWELSHPLAWRARYLPFCPTREQVEFRVLKSIFATAYNIKASHSEFDFSIFLRITHENNILKIIDISYKNWIYILVLTAFAALKLNFWKSSCATESCEIEEDTVIFALCGSVYGVLSIVLWIWGRLLELRLISSAGVENVDDYSVFLMTEFRADEHLSDCATSVVVAKGVISNFLKEKKKLDVISKEEQHVRRHAYMKRFTLNGSDKLKQKPAAEQVDRLKREDGQQEPESDVNKNSVEDSTNTDNNIISRDMELTSFSVKYGGLDSMRLQTSNDLDWIEEKDEELSTKPSSKVSPKRTSTVGCYDDSENNIQTAKMKKPKRLPSLENKLTDRGMSMITNRNKQKSNRRVSLLSMARNSQRKLSRQASVGWKTSVEKLFTRSTSTAAELSVAERESRFAEILDGRLHQLELVFISLIPPLVTFPTIFLAIRSSTIIKAITLLDVAVVANVIELSQVNTIMLTNFRKTLLKLMKKQGPGLEGMIKTCNQFAEKNSNVLKKSDFREMLLHHKVIYTPEKINFLFGSIDLNGGSTVDFGELETFLFADNTYESDRKRQELFHKMSIHKVKRKGKGSNAAVRILNDLNFEAFKDKHFISSE